MKSLEKNILKLFMYNYKLRFNEIEKLIKERSNKISYHLKNLIKKRILSKDKDFYILSEQSEFLIPYLSGKKSILPVILVHLGDNKKCYLIKRYKRPFKNKLSLPGGRILLGESIKDSAKRLMKEKFNVNVRLIKVNSISIEHLKKDNRIIHSYILIFISAKAKDKIILTDINKNKKNIITSDFQLLKKDINKKIDIKTLKTIKF